MRKTLLLIEPPFHRLYHPHMSLDRHPLGLGYLAATVLRHSEWQVDVYQADFNRGRHRLSPNVAFYVGEGFRNYLDALSSRDHPVWAEVRSVVSRLRPAVVGVTGMTQKWGAIRRVVDIVKDVDRDCLVLLGGPHASMAPDMALGHPGIDLCVRGEGESVLLELLDAYSRGREAVFGVPGVSWRHNGRIVHNESRGLIPDLDELPHPHEHAPEFLLNANEFPSQAFGYVFASRGCPYNCLYCGSRSIWSRKVRHRSVANVMDEIEKIRQHWRLEELQFEDDTFSTSRDWTLSLCGALSQLRPRLRWSCETHPRLVTEELARAMHTAGCHSVCLGVESGSPEILRRIRKKLTPEDALRAARTLKANGIEPEAFFMVGFPWETEQTVGATMELIRRIDAAVAYSIFTPYPGTEAFEVCRSMGLIAEDYDPALYNHQSPENCFVAGMSLPEFRRLTRRVERMVDATNRRHLLKNVIRNPARGVRAALRLGWRGTLRKVLAG